jgi:hypothetical protein
MLAGGVSFAVPGVMPEAEAANQHLWVSAEAQGNNFYGAQVLEVVVTDPAINRLDEAYGMPDVTIDGKKIIMAQGVDGSWYAYIADGSFATAVDALYPEVEDGMGADFGSWCKPATNLEYAPYAGAVKSVAQLIPSESRGVAIPQQLGNGTGTTGVIAANQNGGSSTGFGVIGDATQGTYAKGTGITGKCDSDMDGDSNYEGVPSIWLNATAHIAHKGAGLPTGVNATDQAINNVVREARALSNGTTTDFYGNIALGPNLWPFIQVYDFTRYTTYDLVYEKGGADELVALTFDRPSGQGLSFDKPQYGLLHEIGITLTNGELNIDPTDEDSWTYATNPASAATYYQLFDENGTAEADNTNGAIKNTNSGMQGTWGSDEGVLLIDRNGPNDSTYNVIKFQDNGDTVLTCTSQSDTAVTGCSTNDIAAADAAVTFVETGANTGVFANWDDALVTNMYVSEVADRGTQAVVTFNDQAYSVLHMPFWGTVAYDTEYGDGIGAEWNAGEIVGVIVDDEDMNFDARNLDQQTISGNTTIVPSIKIGSPITLANVDSLTLFDGGLEGDEITLDQNINETQCSSNYAGAGTDSSYTSCYEKYSERAIFTTDKGSQSDVTIASGDILRLTYNGTTVGDLKDLISGANGTSAFTYIQYDLRSIVSSNDYYLNFTVGGDELDTRDSPAGTSYYHNAVDSRFNTGMVGSALYNAPGAKVQGFGSMTDADSLQVDIEINLLNSVTGADIDASGQVYPLALDFVTFGQSNDGVSPGDRHNNGIYRLEVDETGRNTGEYISELEYIMLNQLNVNQTSTYNATKHWDDANVIIVHNDLTDEDEVRINYLDMGADGVETQVADQLAAPTHSGVVELDNDSYKEADTVVVTLTDSDLNTNPDIINIYSVVTTVGSLDQYGNSLNDFNDPAYDQVGIARMGANSVGDNNGRMLDITYDDEQWLKASAFNGDGVNCTGTPSGDDGLAAAGFSLVETGANTGVFTGDFQVPAEYCARSSGSGTVTSTMGTDIEVNYVDYRDASGEIIEVGDGAGIRGNTGSVSLDRTVYPVPFGTIGDFSTEEAKATPNSRSVYPLHAGGIESFLDASTETLGNGDLTIHIRVDDPDYDVSATGEDNIAENTTSSSNRGPLKIYVARGSDAVTLATAGGDTAQNGVITTTTTVVDGGTTNGTRELGPISETAPDSGVFELDMTVRYTDGPASSDCPTKTDNFYPTNGDTNEDGSDDDVNAESTRFGTAAASGKEYCILQGDVITVEYSDQNDASGNSGVAYDSATFDLRNGVLQTDKSVYIIGSDIIMTLIEPDLDLETDESETWDLDLIEWDSDAGTVTMGNAGGSASSFDPEPSDFRETGDSTGIFQIVIEVPANLGGSALDRGELIDLEYTDWGPSGANYVGEEYQDIGLSVYTSNFGATIELDQKVYTWTDKVYVTIVAPDHNFDGGLVDMIGDTDDDPLVVQTRSQ